MSPLSPTLPKVISTADIPYHTLQEFLSLAGQGFSRKDRFAATFATPNILIKSASGFSGTSGATGEVISKSYATPQVFNYGGKLTMLCEQISLPGRIINTRSLRINTLNEYRASTADYLGNSITFTFLTDTNWTPRRYFQMWMSGIIGNEIDVSESLSKNASYSNRSVAFYNDYISSISLVVYNPNPSTTRPEVPAYMIKLQEAWPTALHSQQFSYEDTGIQKTTVEFAFKWWEPVDVDTTLDNPSSDPEFTKRTKLPLNINLYNVPEVLQDIYYGANINSKLSTLRGIVPIPTIRGIL